MLNKRTSLILRLEVLVRHKFPLRSICEINSATNTAIFIPLSSLPLLIKGSLRCGLSEGLSMINRRKVTFNVVVVGD